MISSIFSKFLINKIIENETPTFNKGKCINNIQKRRFCDLCKTCCPNEAIAIDQGVILNKEKCNNCSICSNVCPTGAFIPTIKTIERKYNKISRLDDVSIGCKKEEYEADINVECIAELPWDFLAYIALDNKVILSIRNCQSCKLENLKNQVNSNLDKLKMFLGKEKFEKNVILFENDGKLPIKEVSRRELLFMVGEESKRFMSSMVPIELLENKNGRIYRSLLINKIKEKNIKEKFTWCGLTVNKDCYGCGICEKLCPNMAINIQMNSDGVREFRHDYTKCTHCKLCVSVCIDKAITAINRESNNVNERDVFHIKSYSCSVCNDAIKEEDNGICVVCKNKRKSRY